MSGLQEFTEGQELRQTLQNVAAAQNAYERGQSASQTSANQQLAVQAAQVVATRPSNQQGTTS